MTHIIIWRLRLILKCYLKGRESLGAPHPKLTNANLSDALFDILGGPPVKTGANQCKQYRPMFPRPKVQDCSGGKSWKHEPSPCFQDSSGRPPRNLASWIVETRACTTCTGTDLYRFVPVCAGPCIRKQTDKTRTY